MNGEAHAVCQNKEQNSHENKVVEPVEPVQMNTYQVIPIEETMNNFDNEPRSQERQLVKDQESYISVFVVYLTIPSSSLEHHSRHDNSIPCKSVW